MKALVLWLLLTAHNGSPIWIVQSAVVAIFNEPNVYCFSDANTAVATADGKFFCVRETFEQIKEQMK